MEFGAASGQAPRGSRSRVLCRNFARGSCRWDQHCRFSHDRTTIQICRYFQNGYCAYGDRCSYQHTLEAPALASSRRGSEPTFYGTQDSATSLNRHGVEAASLPQASPWSWGGSRRGSEPAVSSMAQLQLNLERMSMSLDEEDEDKENVLAARYSTNGALSREFVPRQALHMPNSRPQELGIRKPTLESENASSKTAQAPPNPEEPKVESGLAEVATATAVVKMKSEDVVCGICMDKVYEKSLPEERVFGILPNCSHAYCVGCIRQWRKSRDFQNAVIKGCPECRVTSSYFIPNKHWVSDAEEKKRLIETFRARTSKIRCKFFIRGNGHCPFKSECIYLHELPTGHLPAARPRRRRRRRRQWPVVFNPSPSDSSDEEDDDVYLVQWAVTFALLESDFDFLDYCNEMLLWDSSDSD
uniref:RING-type E3 ubiquitin transferase n=1 Tax=Sphenodon punctatus TaxID=8508 RepID=A0A8D0HCR3_SPHPU